ncbi:MAG: GntR family transcriptional regulator, partial [Chloroflexota bacterium]|nr:GntR family transcriptional regulator [Chloroflexota bacterium]
MTDTNAGSRRPRPLYRHIERILRAELAANQDEPAPRFTESGLMARFGVSRFTVRQALAELSREGLVVRRQRLGTAPKTRQPIEQPLAGVYSFAGSMRERGVEASSRIISVRTIQPDAALRECLALTEAGCSVVELIRVREADGRPLILESNWIPEELAPGLSELDLTGSIYEILRDRYGVRVTSAKETSRPIVLDSRQAQVLASTRGLPAFFVERVALRG